MNRTRTTVQDRWLTEYLDLEDDFADRRERAGTRELRGETMKCPRCGDLLMQVAVEKVKAERCISCSGVYFDCDELDFLLHAHEPAHLLAVFRSLLTRALPRSDLRPPHLEL